MESRIGEAAHTIAQADRLTAPTPLARLFSPGQVATMLGCTEWWLREQARRSRFPHVRLAKSKIMFAPMHIEQIIAQLSVQAHVPRPDAGDGSVGALAGFATTRSAALHRRDARP